MKAQGGILDQYRLAVLPADASGWILRLAKHMLVIKLKLLWYRGPATRDTGYRRDNNLPPGWPVNKSSVLCGRKECKPHVELRQCSILVTVRVQNLASTSASTWRLVLLSLS
jgi:hypothetical protein